MDFNEKIKQTQELIKTFNIRGCITGSSLMDDVDFDTWDSIPDVDIFVYNQMYIPEAINQLKKAGFELGTGTERSKKQEELKYSWTLDTRINKNSMAGPLSTHKLCKDGVIVNISYKPYQNTVCDVITAFDMSCIMKGYDIKSGVMVDLTKLWGDSKVASPNLLRDHQCSRWTIAKWIRQFDRVIKYWNRGIDTRPMARFYMDMIDEFVACGSVFDTEKSKDSYAEGAQEFTEFRKVIAAWLADKEDC